MPRWSKNLARYLEIQSYRLYETSLQLHNTSVQLTSFHMILCMAFAYGIITYLLDIYDAHLKAAQNPNSQKPTITRNAVIKTSLTKGLTRLGTTALILCILPGFLHLLFPIYFALSAIDQVQRKVFARQSNIQTTVQNWTQKGAVFAVTNGVKLTWKGLKMLYNSR